MLRAVTILFVSLISGCMAIPISTVQGGITGTVLGDESRAPVPGARVYCAERPSESAHTDETGSFSLPEWHDWQWIPFPKDAACSPCTLSVDAATYIQLRKELSCVDSQVEPTYLLRKVSQ